jgi:hypothetical protein
MRSAPSFATRRGLPPTDQAFADIPEAEQAPLLADPDALGDMYKAHTTEAYVPWQLGANASR